MKDALTFLVSGIVDNPDQVVIDETDDNGLVNVTISVAKEDMGKVIGKEGKVIRAIRNVMKMLAIKQNKKINISITENA